HPHIFRYTTRGIDGQPYYVMPYIEGESLRQRITRQKAMPISDALRFATEIAGALGYAHEHGLPSARRAMFIDRARVTSALPQEGHFYKQSASHFRPPPGGPCV